MPILIQEPLDFMCMSSISFVIFNLNKQKLRSQETRCFVQNVAIFSAPRERTLRLLEKDTSAPRTRHLSPSLNTLLPPLLRPLPLRPLKNILKPSNLFLFIYEMIKRNIDVVKTNIFFFELAFTCA